MQSPTVLLPGYQTGQGYLSSFLRVCVGLGAGIDLDGVGGGVGRYSTGYGRGGGTFPLIRGNGR